MPGTKPPGLSASQSRQPCEGPRLNSDSLTRGTFDLHEDPAHEANSQPVVQNCHREPVDFTLPVATAAHPGSPYRPAGRPQQSSATGQKTQFGLLTPPSQRSLKKSPSSVRSPTSSIAFPGSFVLRQSAPPESQEANVDAQALSQLNSEEQGSKGHISTCQAKNGPVPSEPRPWPNSIPDEIGDSKLSPVPLSPSSSAFASFSPGDIDFGQKDLAKAAEVMRADAETQTTPPSAERTPSSKSRPRTPHMLQGALWSKSGNLPACVSALAMRDEVEDSISNRCCLRKLEMRIAPCWRNDDSLRESDHSSLQVSSTQSPSTEGHEQGKRRSPLDSFSSLSSPLDHSSVLKDVENISPVADKITRRDVEKLPVDELRKRAKTLTQKLERREQQCMALREALQKCKNRWHTLCPQ